MIAPPILFDGALVSGAKWNDPCVIAESSGFTMWASCGAGFSGDISIYRLRSTDRKTWALSPSTPVLKRSATGIDARAVETPSVVKFGGLYHMFYTGYPADHADSKSYRILHATSTNGKTWTRDPVFVGAPSDPANPVPNMDFHQWVVAEPGAVVVNGKIHLYFTAIGANAQTQTDLQTIGLTTSTDGKSWAQPQMVLMPDQSIFPRATFYGYSTPAACVMNGSVVLFFSIVQANPWGQVGIGNAISSEGVSGWRLNTLTTLSREGWASKEILAPSPLVDAAGLHLWFAGNDGQRLGIGYAKIG